MSNEDAVYFKCTKLKAVLSVEACEKNRKHEPSVLFAANPICKDCEALESTDLEKRLTMQDILGVPSVQTHRVDGYLEGKRLRTRGYK